MARALACALLALALAGCGGGSHTSTAPTEAALGTAVPDRSTTTRTTVPRAHRRGRGVRRLEVSLVRALRPAGRQVGALVYDLTARTRLFRRHENVRRSPASIEKLYTTIAADALLGPRARLHTDVLGSGFLAGRVWHGSLYLRGGGDPTFGDAMFNRQWESGYGPTPSELVAALKSRGIARVTGRVIGDESLFDRKRGGPATRFAPDLPDYGGRMSALVFDHGASSPKLAPAAFAAHQLAVTMRASHIAAKASSVPGAPPAGATLLASVSSPPVSTLLRLMDHPSDNLFADLLAKQLGARFAQRGTLAAGARVISTVITANYGLRPTILDGSGLDKADRSSPAEIVELLRAVWRTPPGQVLAGALPLVGEEGTVRRIATGTAAQGHCVAKTGTLNYVTNLAGYCTARGGHVLAFAVFLDGPANWQALPMLSRIVAAIFRY